MSAKIWGPLKAMLIAALATPLTPASALAQSSRAAASPAPASAPAPAAEGPERTVAVFADWAMRCEARPASGSAPAARICEMAQTTQDQRQQPVAVLALGRSAKGEPLRLVAQVPVNVQVTQAARLVLDIPGKTEAPLSLAFRNCSPRGCFADLELRDEAVLRRLRGRPADAAGRLEWRDATGTEAAIPVSFRGFAPAYDALAKEAD